jgi:hypothetical protein
METGKAEKIQSPEMSVVFIQPMQVTRTMKTLAKFPKQILQLFGWK